MISGENNCKSCRKTFQNYRKLTVTTLYILVVSCYINMKQNVTNHDRNIRSKFNFHLQFYGTVAFHNSVTNVAIKINNKFPDSTKHWIDLNSWAFTFIPSVQMKSFIFLNKVGWKRMRLFISHFNSCIRLLWMYFIVILYWTVYRKYCFLFHRVDNYFMIAAVWDFV
jgi:hypothetical protein